MTSPSPFPSYKRECTTVSEKVCTGGDSYQEPQCHYEPRQDCVSVPVEECQDTPREVCQQVPDTQCKGKIISILRSVS